MQASAVAVAQPLMKQAQLNAIFQAFDRNRDGDISPDELESFLRILDPDRRLARLKPIPVPRVPSKLEVLRDKAIEEVTPYVGAFQNWWEETFAKPEDEEDESFVVRVSSLV